MTVRLAITPGAEADLQEIANWIAEAAGPEIAIAYVERLRARCRTLLDFPLRGSPRGPDGRLRSIPFERRATIVYRVAGDVVSIVGIFHAGREIDIG